MIFSRSVFSILALIVFGASWACSAAPEEAPIDLDPTTPEAQFELAVRYLGGDGVRPSDRKGIHWLKIAAKADYLPAQNHLAICYRQGTGFFFKSRRKAEKWFLAAAEAGYLPAMFNLANAYLEDDEAAGMEQARPWLERAAAWELDEALSEDDYNLFTNVKGAANMRLGRFFLERDEAGDEALAFGHIQAAADLGDIDGQLNAARCFALGLGTEPALEEAERYLDNAGHNVAVRIRQAGDTYFTAAVISVHEAYAIEEEAVRESRRLVREMRVSIANEMADSDEAETDPAMALDWFRKAAEAGSHFAAARVANLWMRNEARGDLTESEMLALLQEAAENKIVIAYQGLGYYWTRIADPADPEKGREWYQRALDEGMYAAYLALQGDETILPMTFPESMKLAERDAIDGWMEAETVITGAQLHALFAMGVAAWYGVGQEVDRGLAAKRFQAAAQRGHPEAAFYTGLAYFQGHLSKFAFFDSQAGVKEAYRQLQQGAEDGSIDATYMLGLFNLHGISLLEPNFPLALEYFRRVRASGDVARGAYGMGRVYVHADNPDRDPAQAVESFAAAAEAGDLDSMIYLAYLLVDEESGVPRDLDRAREWAQNAIAEDEDDGRGYFFLGRVLEASDPPAIEEAYVEFERAAIRGHPVALEKVAPAYLTGEHLTYNPRIAARFYRQLVARRHREYVDDLVKAVYESGDEIELRELIGELRDAHIHSAKASLYDDFFTFDESKKNDRRRRARAGIKRAARNGDADAQLWLLERYYQMEKPTSSLRKFAAEMTAESNPDGYYYLALALQFSDRWGITGNTQTMIREAAEAGSILAIEALNQQRLVGQSDAPSVEQLKAWLQPKADKGFEDAIDLLDTILEEESPEEPEAEGPETESVSGYGEGIA